MLHQSKAVDKNLQTPENTPAPPPPSLSRLTQRHNFDPNTVTARKIQAIKMPFWCATQLRLENNNV